jgi:ABC-type dipeptide/oligopeptide/nickel transport system permease subunit
VSSIAPTGAGTARAGRGSGRRRWRRLVRRYRGGLLGIPLVGAVLAAALLATRLAPFPPLEMHAGQELRPPLTRFLLGSDEFGRDLLSRILFGARISLVIGVTSVMIGTALGGTAGVAAGFLRGRTETVVLRLADCLLSFPPLILGIAVATILGPGAMNAAVAVGIVTIPAFARLAWTSVLGEKAKDYVRAIEGLGASGSRIVGRHILPNVAGVLLVQMTIAMAQAVLLEASLSFLGLGTQPPDPSWGGMLNDSRAFLREAPWYGLFPGLALSVLLLGLNLAADSLRDLMDPRTRIR